MLFALAVALPLLALAFSSIWQQNRTNRLQAEEALVAQAHAMALLVDNEFLDAERMLHVLAGSAALARGDLPAFWSEIRSAATIADSKSINLIGPDLTIRLSSSWQPGEWPDAKAAGPASQVLASGQTLVSDLFVSPVVGNPTLAVAVPVRVPGADSEGWVWNVLGFVVPRDRLLATLSRQRLPAEAIAAVLDRNLTIVARTTGDSEALGQRPSPEVARAMAGDSGVVPFVHASIEGAQVVAAYALAPWTGYRVQIIMPAAAFAAPLRGALWSTALIGMALLGASLLLGTAMARRIAGSLRQLGAADGSGPSNPHVLREVNELAEVLARNAAQREHAVAELRALFDGSPVGVVRSDAGGRVQDANDAFLRIVGMTRTDLANGRVRWDDLTPPEWIGRDEAAIAEAMRAGSCEPYQKEFVRADGTRIPVLTFFAFHDRATGAAAAFVVDLSPWNATEADLRRAHEQMRLAIGAARMFFWDWDLTTNVVEWSDGLEAACGLPPGGFGGTVDAFRALIHPDDLPQTETALGRALAGEADYDTEFRMWRADGSVRWVVARGTVLRDGAGRPLRMVGIDFDVTDRKTAEIALAESEARLHAAHKVGRIGVWEWHPGSGWTTCSAEYMRIYGLPPDAPTPSYDDWLGCVHPDDRAAADAATRQGLAAGEYDHEFRILRADGEVRWIATRGVVQRDAAGQPARFLGVNIDITARRAERAASFLDLAAALPAIIFITGPDGLNTYVNNHFPTYTGLPAEALLGSGWLSVLHPEDRGRAAITWNRAVEAGTSYQAEYRFRRHDGAWRWFLCRGEPQRDAAGRILRWIGTATDIDELHSTADALSAAEDRLRLAIEAADLGVWSWDLRAGTVDMSLRCRALYGILADEVVDYDRLLAALHPEDRPATDLAIVDAVSSRTDYDVAHRVLSPDGEVHWRRARGRAAFGPDGSAWTLRGVVMDIDEQKRAESALRADKDQLEVRIAERSGALSLAAAELTAETRRREAAQAALLQAQKLEALGQLTGGVAHDFNNVLAAVIGCLRLISRRVDADSDIAGIIRSGERAAQRAVSLIRQLLAFARREDLSPSALDPAALLAGTEELVRHALGHGIRLQVEAPAGLWPILADQHQLEVALLNLAVNARDAMTGRGTITMSLRNAAAPADARSQDDRPSGLRMTADYVVIAVRDTGPGMSPETLARATEPFFTTKPQGQGTGLGLAMVHGFAHQSGGALRILSAPGEGTTVEIWMPRAAGAAPRDLAEATPDAAMHGGATLLVVDDDDTVRSVMVTSLRDLGYQVLEANGASAAVVQALAAERLDLVITDLAMPEGDGPALAARLRADRPDLAVLFVSGYAERHGLTAQDVLAKPFTPDELGMRVLAALGRLRPRPDRLLGRLQRAELREAYLAWCAVRDSLDPGGLPALEAIGLPGLSGEPHAYVIAVQWGADTHPTLRYQQVGPALATRIGRRLDGALVDAAPHGDEDAVFGGLADIYRRCATLGIPCYDYARYGAAGGAPPVLLERLLLPMADDGGQRPTHLLGFVAFSGLT